MNISIIDLLFIFFFVVTILPILQYRYLEFQRFNLIKQLEQKRKSRVIVLIHRQEVFSFLGLPFSRFIDIEDSESILRAIRLTSVSTPIDIIIHTPGGLVLASEQIAKALVKHKAKVTVFIPHYAMSGGSLIAFAGDEIMMDENAVLSPLDPQIGEYPAVSLLSVLKRKPIKDIDDKTIILADVARKGLKQVCEVITDILMSNNMKKEKAVRIANLLSSGQWTHDYPIDFKQAKEIGLPVQVGLPREIYKLMEFYPQSGGRRPSVQYIPVPYSPGPERRRQTRQR